MSKVSTPPRAVLPIPPHAGPPPKRDADFLRHLAALPSSSIEPKPISDAHQGQVLPGSPVTCSLASASQAFDMAQLQAAAPSNVSVSCCSDIPGWSRVYAEHLIGNGYLSVVDALANGASTPRPEGLRASESARALMQASVGGELALGGAETESEPFEVFNACLRPGEAVPEGSLDEQFVSRSPTPNSNVADDFAWAERSLRITRNSQGMSTVWLRDYALSNREVVPLVERIRRQACREGIAITRIVINGHEAWHASTSEEGN